MELNRKMKDLTGKRFNLLTAIKPLYVNKNRSLVWLWKCDCGEEFEAPAESIKTGSTTRCHKCSIEKKRKQLTKHGMWDSPEWNIWGGIVSRCCCESAPMYEMYGAAGIKMSKEFEESFEKWYSEMGPMPKDGQRWTCGRIDGLKGYEKGNIRWETYKTQAHNRRKLKNNTSGVTGVRQADYPNGSRWIAFWKSLDGKAMSKSFSISKWGEEFSRFLAEETRDLAIRRMNLVLGESRYTEYHGK